MPRLTERRHLQTKDEIAQAAIALFSSQGYDQVTMSQVAEAAGVSRRTVYRHFPKKDDLVFEHPRRWLHQLETGLAGRAPDESLRELLRRVLLSIAASIEETRGEVLAAFAVLQSTESLSGTHRRTDDLWIERIVELFMKEPGFQPANIQAASVVAAATTATTNMAIGLWALGQPEADLIQITDAALDQIDPIWPAPFR